jgi:hypothetical protein
MPSLTKRKRSAETQPIENPCLIPLVYLKVSCERCNEKSRFTFILRTVDLQAGLVLRRRDGAIKPRFASTSR